MRGRIKVNIFPKWLKYKNYNLAAIPVKWQGFFLQKSEGKKKGPG